MLVELEVDLEGTVAELWGEQIVAQAVVAALQADAGAGRLGFQANSWVAIVRKVHLVEETKT